MLVIQEQANYARLILCRTNSLVTHFVSANITALHNRIIQIKAYLYIRRRPTSACGSVVSPKLWAPEAINSEYLIILLWKLRKLVEYVCVNLLHRLKQQHDKLFASFCNILIFCQVSKCNQYARKCTFCYEINLTIMLLLLGLGF